MSNSKILKKQENLFRFSFNDGYLRKPISIMFKIRFESSYLVITRKDLVITRKLNRNYEKKRSRNFEKKSRYYEKRSRNYEKIIS